MEKIVRPESMVRITDLALANAFIDEQVELARKKVGDKKVRSRSYAQKTHSSFCCDTKLSKPLREYKRLEMCFY